MNAHNIVINKVAILILNSWHYTHIMSLALNLGEIIRLNIVLLFISQTIMVILQNNLSVTRVLTLFYQLFLL